MAWGSTYVEYMPFLKISTSETTRSSSYRTLLDKLTLDKVSAANSDGKAIVRHDFALDAASVTDPTALLELQTLYMPTDGVVYYYPSGTQLPNKTTGTQDTLLIKPAYQSLQHWLKYHPYYSHFVTEIYITNFNATETKSRLKTILSTGYVGSDSYKDITKVLYEIFVSSALPSTDAEIIDNYFSFFTGTAAQRLGLFADGGQVIGLLDASSSSKIECSFQFTNTKKFPLKPGEDEYDAIVGSRTEEDAVYDASGTAAFFRYRQRIPSEDGSMVPMAGHPMIVLMVAADAGYVTNDLAHAERSKVAECFECTRVDFVDLGDPLGTQKYHQSNVDYRNFDHETDPPTVMRGAPIPDSAPSDFKSHYPSWASVGTERIRFTVYNPDGISLDAASANGYVEAEEASSAYDRGDGTIKRYSDFYFNLTPSVTSSTSSILEDTITIRKGSSAGMKLRDVKVMIFPFKSVPFRAFDVTGVVDEGDGTTSEVNWGFSNGGPDGEFHGLRANIWFYPSRDSRTIKVEVEGADFSYSLFKKKNRSGTYSTGDLTTQGQTFLSNCSSGFNFFYVSDLEEKSIEGDQDGVTWMSDDKILIIIENQSVSKLDDERIIEAHEINHGLADKYLAGDSRRRHFHHHESDIGDFALEYNVSSSATNSDDDLLTSNQARILSGKL